jgi:GTP1/Obg family GTP-binding protein
MTVSDQQLAQAFYSKKPVGDLKAFSVVFKEVSGDYFQKYFYAKDAKEAKLIGKEYVARFEANGIASSAVVRRAV